MRASWGAAVASRVNELCAMAPANMLARDGFGGIGAQPLPANLRDRRGAAGQPMPFDVRAELETSEDGTQKRLVIRCFPGSTVWCNSVLCNPANDTPAPDSTGWAPLLTGEWIPSADALTGLYGVFLHYRLQAAPDWDASLSPLHFSAVSLKYKATAEELSTISGVPVTLPYGNSGFYYGLNQVVVGWLRLGTVDLRSGVGISVNQEFHGTLVLSDLLQANVGEGGGSGSEAESAKRGCWKLTLQEPEGEGEGVGSFIISDCYYNVGGITKLAGPFSVSAAAEGFLCALFAVGGNVSVGIYATLSALAIAQANESTYIVPLYVIGSGTVRLDMRNAPQIQVFEGTL